MKKGLNYYNCICKNYKKELINKSDVIKCTFCGLYSHKDCLPYLNLNPKDFICPECQLLLINPLSRIQLILLYPSLLDMDSHSISNKNINLNFLEKNIFKFDIPIDFRLIESNRDDQLLNVFIVIYCLKLEGRGFKNEWPLDTSFYINESTDKFFGSKKFMIDNNKRYLPLIFSYHTQTKYYFSPNYYINLSGRNFMEKNFLDSVNDRFIQGSNTIHFYFDNIENRKNENNLYVITIRREFLVSPEFAVNILLQNSYITFYDKKKLEKKPEFKEKEMKDKLFPPEFKSKGIFCKHKELFDVLKLLQKYYIKCLIKIIRFY